MYYMQLSLATQDETKYNIVYFMHFIFQHPMCEENVPHYAHIYPENGTEVKNIDIYKGVSNILYKLHEKLTGIRIHLVGFYLSFDLFIN